MARGERSRPLEWGVATRTRPGEADAGDLAVVTRTGAGMLVAAIDGAGHGREAARAARAGADVLRDSPGDDLHALVLHCHEALRETRGAALSLAVFPDDLGLMTWVGIGNVQGAVFGDDGTVPRPKSVLRLTSGVVGHELSTVRRETLALCHGDVLVLATDGIHAALVDSLLLRGSPHEIAERALEDHWKPEDDGLVLVVRYLG